MQFSIREILVLTCFAGLWMASYRIWPSVAVLLVGPLMLCAAAMAVRRVRMLIWLPLVATLNFLFLNIVPPWWWAPPSEIVLYVMVATVSIVSTLVFALSTIYRKNESWRDRHGILYKGIGYSAFGGLLAGLQIGLPFAGVALFAMVLATFGFPISPDFALAIAFSYPVMLCMAGAIIGVPLGFVADIMLALKFKKQERRQRKI